MGFAASPHNPCIFVHTERRLCYAAHGDDFVGAGTRDGAPWVVEQIRTSLIVKDRGTLGSLAEDSKSMRLLNRLVTWQTATAAPSDHLGR